MIYLHITIVRKFQKKLNILKYIFQKTVKVKLQVSFMESNEIL